MLSEQALRPKEHDKHRAGIISLLLSLKKHFDSRNVDGYIMVPI